MEKFFIGLIPTLIGLIIGFIWGSNNTVSEEQYDTECKEYKQTISFYQDYIEGLDKTLQLDTLNNPALSVLRAKLPTDSDNYKELR